MKSLVALLLVWTLGCVIALPSYAMDTSMQQMQSTLLQGERRYYVSLPERYEASNRRYSVLYIVDADFQFEHVAATVRNLARMGRIEPLIVVGIAFNGEKEYQRYTSWRTTDLDVSGDAPLLLDYLNKELLPLINQRYRTTKQQAIAGYSLGGLLVLQAMLQPQSPFSAFYAMSPSLFLDNYALNKKLASAPLRGRLFLSVANEQGMGVAELADLLKPTNAALQWHFAQFAQDTHYSTALPALLAALQWDFADYGLDSGQLLALGDENAVLTHFRARKAHWSSYHMGWLQAWNLAKYYVASKQLQANEASLQAWEQVMPGASHELRIQLVKALLKYQQVDAVAALVANAPASLEQSHDWQKQLADFYAARGELPHAKQAQRKAEALARAQHLAEWEYQELAPGSYQ